jgi:hypothetical protein
LLAAVTAAAGPLNRADVPAAPNWALHLDCDGLRPTAIGQFILTEMEKPEAQAKLGAFETVFNIDLRKQLHGITLYSTGPSSDSGVMVIYADFEPERLLKLAKGANGYKSTEHNNHTIHNWIDDKKKAKEGVKPRVYASVAGSRAIIFGQQESAVASALDVMDGTAAALASSANFPQFGAAGDASFLQAAAHKLNVSESDPNTAIFRLSKEARFQVGEKEGQTTASLTLEASDEEVAKNIVSVAHGLAGLLKLQQNKPEVTKLAEAIAVKQDGTRVTASATMPSTEVVAIMKADAERKAKKKAAEQ